ncbi:PhnD/SsuA/transferrin family substrate-binding protein [Rhodospirillaceae bacterium SYSU D60014]|uniref:phosphate/phosphite/phosphonate ABC transporter substrate-binding protein n=1 Tax=Virgifigura deserti TaxID=2268457 RepID=UPI0013C4B918
MARASLPMYDLPEVAAATDAWWGGLARAFRREGLPDVPERLRREGTPLEHWLAPDLLFGQTCGYPLTHALAGRVTLVATPCYQAAGCAGPEYRSFVIVAAESPAIEFTALRGKTCAVNSADSQSGYNALRTLVAPLSRDGRFFSQVVASGSHRASLGLVASGAADVAAIDCVTHALLARHSPAVLDGTRVLCETAAAPGLPYVTAISADEERLRRLRAGLRRALDDPDLAAARDALLLADAEVLPLATYDRILELKMAAVGHGYHDLA